MYHVYLMPGMAASSSIFEHWVFPEDRFTLHRLDWLLPAPKESLSDYAQRMCAYVKHEYPVLIGVSFGGVLVQEMAKHITVKKLIIISSIKVRTEMPRRFILLRKLKLYYVLPTRLFEDVEKLAKYAFGETLMDRLNLYKRYLSMNDKNYLNWAIKNMVCWDQEQAPPGVIHIHGEKDKILPTKYIENALIIPNGTHIMVITKYKWFNQNLPLMIENV